MKIRDMFCTQCRCDFLSSSNMSVPSQCLKRVQNEAIEWSKTSALKTPIIRSAHNFYNRSLSASEVVADGFLLMIY